MRIISSIAPKRIDLYLLKTYIGPFILTFCVSQFVLVMQFLWKYIDDLVGKGLDNIVVVKLLLYASASMVPLALPLAVLLSSIMTFGNLGENFELTAAKASGISLLRFMRGLIVFTVFTCIGAFFFSNYGLPHANLKFQQLLYDVRRMKPAFNIRPGVFNSGIEGVTIRVKRKDVNETLYDMVIYDHSNNRGCDNIVIAKKGKLFETEDRNTLILRLYDGTRFQENETNIYNTASKFEFIRTSFRVWEKRFDLSQFRLSKTDDSFFKGLQAMMNIKQLSAGIDSTNGLIDAKKQELYKFYKNYLPETKNTNTPIKSADLYADFNKLDTAEKRRIIQNTTSKIRNLKGFVEATAKEIEYKTNDLIQYEVEWHRKFTLSVACLVLFFIGAPLGAIIRKGGLGWPMFLSVVFFILFHVTNIVGQKMAEGGTLSPLQGMWLATFILVPIGTFLTIKAKNDSALFNSETYEKIAKNILGLFKKKTVVQKK